MGPVGLQTYFFPCRDREPQPLAELLDRLLDWQSKGSDDEKSQMEIPPYQGDKPKATLHPGEPKGLIIPSRPFKTQGW